MTAIIFPNKNEYSDRKILGKTATEHLTSRLSPHFDKILILDGGLDFEAINDEKTGMLVLSGDMPLVNAHVINALLEFHMKNGNGISRIGNSDGADCGVYFFNASVFFGIQLTEGISTIQNLIEDASKRDVKTANLIVYDQTPFEKADGIAGFHKLSEMLRVETNYILAENRVQFIDLARCYIDTTVKIGAGTLIYPDVIIEGGTVIGENCIIEPGCHLRNMKIGNGVKMSNTVASDSEIGDKTTTGPFAYIRPGSKIGSGCKVGDFVEVKNSVMGDGTKASHLTYIGDADLGERINLGCGTVIVNYDGRNKFRTVIEDDCFIGCNANLVSPVTVKKGAFIAAGSTITEDVPEDALAVARARQVNKLGWKRP